jgi:ferredoxin-NADP reductase
MAKHAQAKKLPLHIFFMYSNKEAQDIPFKQALDALQTESIQITHTLTREEGTAWKGRKGRVNAEMIQELVPEWGKAIYYLCGPQKMVDALRQVLEELGIQKENVQFENFTGY